MRIVVIAGNIGAGKSTTIHALREFMENDGVCFVLEPVEEWREKGYLEEFYKTGNAFEFQLQVLYSRIAAYEKALKAYLDTHNQQLPALVVLDRWFAEDREFARINYLRGSMTSNQFGIYETAYAYLLKHYPAPDQSIWLDVKPETCLARLQTRGRAEEVSGITLDYLREIDQARENYSLRIAADPEHSPYDVALRILHVLVP